MRTGWAIRQGRELDRLGEQPCPQCAHRTDEHRNHRPTWAYVDGDLVETPHPDYHPLAFKCDRCECVLRRIS